LADELIDDSMPEKLPSLDIQPCHLGVIFALGIESGYLEDSLQGLVTIRGEGFKAKEGGLKGRRVVVFLSGPGRENAAKAVETLIDGHKPRFILSTGFAGGLSPSFERHDIVSLSKVLLESGESISVSHLPNEEEISLLTADHVIQTAEEKKSLFEKTGAAAVDMETSAVAEVCRRRGVPCFAVRAIHDEATETLPPDIEKLLNQKTEAARLGAAIGALWKRPSSFKDMWTLKENSLVAAKKLADFIAAFVEKIG
jgi:adenosylhomocysteine nucleosidase